MFLTGMHLGLPKCSDAFKNSCKLRKIKLFESLPKETNLELIESKNYATGAVEIKYKVI
jgi:hypothetical protein